MQLTRRNELVRRAVQAALGLACSILAGLIGGAVCGAAIAVFAGLIGTTCDPGTSCWEIEGFVPTAVIFGACVGAIVTPFAYLPLVRKIGFRRAWCPAAIGTLIGGSVGFAIFPPVVFLTGVFGFFAALCWVSEKRQEGLWWWFPLVRK